MLQPNTTYYYRVKAINSNSESDYSSVMTVITLNDNSENVTPIGALTPTLYKVITQANRTLIWLLPPGTNEYIKEYKLTLSVNSDYSAPLYNSLTYTINKNINYAIENGIKYIVLTVGNLASNTIYYVRIKSSNTVGQSGNLDFSFLTEKTLQPPDLIGVTNLTAITARVNWNIIASATSYQLDVSSNSNFTSLVINNVSTANNYYDIPTLIENTTYYYRVRSVNASVTSKNSDVLSFTTLDSTNTYPDLTVSLTAPTLNQIQNINRTEFEVVWNPVSRATNYRVDIATDSGFTSLIVNNYITTNTRYKATGLNPNTIYYFRVRAQHPSLNSSYTTSIITTLSLNTNLTVPQLLTPSTTLSTGFILTWVKRNYANRYFLQISTSNIFSSILSETYLGDIDTFTIDNLTPGTTYYLRLYALSNIESSNPSNTLIVSTSATLPSIPLLTTTNISSNTAQVNWTTNAAYNNYLISINKKLERSSYLGDGYFYERSIGNVNTYLLDVFLEPNITYQYIITGVTSSGDRNVSSVGEFTTLATAPFLGFSTDGKGLEWNGDCNRIEIATDKDFKFLVPGYNPRTVDNTIKNFQLGNIIHLNTNYYIKGYTQTGSIKSGISNILSTFNTYPLLLAPDVTNNSVLLRWKAIDSTSYRIQVKVNSGSNYTPISGHLYPVNVGNTTSYFIDNLASDTDYSVQIAYLQTNGKFSNLSLPLYFHTPLYNSSISVTTNSGLTAPTLNLTNADFDRFTIGITGTYSKYIVEVSKQSNFLIIDKYIEYNTSTVSDIYIASSNTPYYVRVYGVSAAQKSPVASANISTTTLPTYNTSLSSAPVLGAFTVLNATEGLISWSDISGAYGFVVEISTSNSFSILDNTVIISYTDKTKALLSALSSTSIYYVRVYAFNDNSISNYSNIITVDTTP